MWKVDAPKYSRQLKWKSYVQDRPCKVMRGVPRAPPLDRNQVLGHSAVSNQLLVHSQISNQLLGHSQASIYELHYVSRGYQKY